MIRKRGLLAVWVGAVACGGNVLQDTAPVLVVQRIVITVPEDGTATIDATATDAQTTKLTYEPSAPAHGVLTGTGPMFAYRPVKNYHGPDTLDMEISDGSNVLTVPVDITVTPVDDAPVVADVAISTPADQGVAIVLVAGDVDSAAFSYAVVTQPTHGTLAGAPPDLVYTPDPSYAGADAFTYQASDGVLASNVATVAITVAGR